MQLVTLLNIPVNLVGSGDVTLWVAYQKYCAYLTAVQTLNKMLAEKTWTIQKPTKTDIIELFVSKSFFHSHYRRLFSKVAEYPKMAMWLENRDQVDDVEVWGVQKDVYVFKDLDFWLKNSGSREPEEQKEKKEKGEKEKGKGKKDKKKKVQKGRNK
jgi:hypothetical protein